MVADQLEPTLNVDANGVGFAHDFADVIRLPPPAAMA